MQKKQSPQIENEDQELEPESYLNKVVYFPSGNHVWRQQGPYAVCKDCELHHAVFIGMDKIIIGEDENGKPILRDKSSL